MIIKCEYHPRLPAIGNTHLLNSEDELENVFLCEQCFRRLTRNEKQGDRVVEAHLEKKAREDGEEKFAYYVVRRTDRNGIDAIPVTKFELVNPMIHNDDSEVLSVKQYPTQMNLYQAKQYIWANFDEQEYTE